MTDQMPLDECIRRLRNRVESRQGPVDPHTQSLHDVDAAALAWLEKLQRLLADGVDKSEQENQ